MTPNSMPAVAVRRSRAAAALLLLAAVPAQDERGIAAAAPAPVELIVQNLASSARREWVVASVPFAAGAIPAGSLPAVHVDGCPTVWQPFGARWADGSLRQALALFHAELGGLEERRLRLVPGAAPALPPGQPAVPDLRFEFVLRRGGRIDRAAPEFAEILEENAARRVELWRCRIGASGLIGELILTAWRGQEHLAAQVGVFCSDPTTESMQCGIDELGLDCRGLALVLRFGERLGMRQRSLDDGSYVALLSRTVLGDGQGIRRTGILVPRLRGDGSLRDHTLLAAVTCPPLAATAAWVEADAWGPFGVVPDLGGWSRDPRQVRVLMGARHGDFVRSLTLGRGDPFWNSPLGLGRQANQTGDQGDFGVTKLGAVVATGMPSLLLEVEAAVMQEACRPTHFFEADGRPVAAAAHPDWVVWAGRTHWHCEVSTDRLGKPCPEPRFETHGWCGKDREHWSMNYPVAFYLLTGDHGLRREIENEVELYLAGQTVDPKLTTSGAGAPRGAGRALLTACWLYQCTGNDSLRQRIADRVRLIHLPAWSRRERPATEMRPLVVYDPDPRELDGKTPCWTPWMEAIAAVGYGAVHRMFGDANARTLAAGVATNVVRHGFKLTDREAVIATAIRWRDDGRPLDAGEIERSARRDVVWSYGTAFTEWGIGAVILAAAYAAEDGDAATAARARRILELVRTGRQRASSGVIDRFAEFAAVR